MNREELKGAALVRFNRHFQALRDVMQAENISSDELSVYAAIFDQEAKALSLLYQRVRDESTLQSGSSAQE